MKLKILIVVLFFQNYVFSQNPFVEFKFGISNIQYYELIAEIPGFHNGKLFQVNLGNEFDLKKRNLFIGASIFYRELNNSLNVDWINYVPYNKKKDFILNTKLVGLRTEIKKKIFLYKKDNIHFSPKIGLSLGYFTSQNFINPIYYDESFSLYYDGYYLNENKNDVNILDDFYFANNLGFDLSLNLKKISIYLYPEIEYQFNHIFRKKQYDESYINYNLGIGMKYDF